MGCMSKKLLLGAALLLTSVSGCSWIDDLGRHMPVIGERCENWQCFTSSGQAQSEATKRSLMARERKGIPLNERSAPVAAEPAPAMPVESKELTPFDMTPEQLDGSQSPY